MKPDEFCRWLQGFAELNEKPPSDAQWKSIREHLQTVFEKVTPPIEKEKRKATSLEEVIEEMRRQPPIDHVYPGRIC